MRAQLIELTAPSRTPARNARSSNRLLTMRWQSSKSPSTAMQCTLASATVVICRCWMADGPPFGNMTKHSTPGCPDSPWIALDPVSPDVAASTVILSPDLPST